MGLTVTMKIIFLLCSVKGYLRKGAVLLAMKEPTKATIAYQKALEIDANNSVSTLHCYSLSFFFFFKRTLFLCT